MAVAVNSKRDLAMNMPYHFPSSDQVLVFSWVSVLAVTTPRVWGKVEMAQRVNQLTRADLPTPCPEAVASWMAIAVTLRRSDPSASRALMLVRIRVCQGWGPVAAAR